MALFFYYSCCLLGLLAAAAEDDVSMYVAEVWQDQQHVYRYRETCQAQTSRVRSLLSSSRSHGLFSVCGTLCRDNIHTESKPYDVI